MKTSVIDSPTALYWASFNRFEMRIPGEAVCDIAQQGDNMPAVAHWAPIVAAQVEADGFRNRPTPDKIRAVLEDMGFIRQWKAEADAAIAKATEGHT